MGGGCYLPSIFSLGIVPMGIFTTHATSCIATQHGRDGILKSRGFQTGCILQKYTQMILSPLFARHDCRGCHLSCTGIVNGGGNDANAVSSNIRRRRCILLVCLSRQCLGSIIIAPSSTSFQMNRIFRVKNTVQISRPQQGLHLTFVRFFSISSIVVVVDRILLLLHRQLLLLLVLVVRGECVFSCCFPRDSGGRRHRHSSCRGDVGCGLPHQVGGRARGRGL